MIMREGANNCAKTVQKLCKKKLHTFVKLVKNNYTKPLDFVKFVR